MHVNYLILAIGMIVLLVFLWEKWDFVSKALSDNGNPSATRLSGFIFVLVIAINETYTTLRTQKFDIEHLKWILIAIMVLFGMVKVAEIFSFFGRQPASPLPPVVTQQTTTQEQSTTVQQVTQTTQPNV